MIALRDRRTRDLFDRGSELGEKRRRLLERSWAEVFRNHLFEDLPVDELFPHFDQRMGHPSKDFHIVIGALQLLPCMRRSMATPSDDMLIGKALAAFLIQHQARPGAGLTRPDAICCTL